MNAPAPALWERDALEVTDQEGDALLQLAREVPAGMSIVEIGSYRGRSTCYLAEGSRAGDRCTVYAVDLWDGHPGWVGRKRKKRPYAELSVRAHFLQAVTEHGDGLVVPLQGDSITIARGFTERVGLLFVDGSHIEEDVLADCRAWLPKVPPTGVVAFHDWDLKGVPKAAAASLPTNRWRWLFTVERLRAFRRFA